MFVNQRHARFDRDRAHRFACLASAGFDAAEWGSRFKAFKVARDRFVDGFA